MFGRESFKSISNLFLFFSFIATSPAVAEDRLFVAGSTSSNVVSFSLATGGDAQVHAQSGVAGFMSPQSFAFSAAGDLLVCEWGLGSIQRFDPTTAQHLQILVNAGNGGLNLPADIVATGAGTILVASHFSDSILEFNETNGAFVRVFADSTDGLSRPRSLVRSFDGNIIVANATGDDLVILNGTTGNVVRFIARDDIKTPQDESGGLDNPGGIVVDQSSQTIFVTSRGTHEVLRFDYNSGDFSGTLVTANSGGLNAPTGIVRAADGTWLVASFGTSNIKRFGANGAYLSDFNAPFAGGVAGPLALMIVGDDAGLVGDLNCDGVVSVSDIGGFVLALTNAAGYAMQFPNCDIANADVNADGQVTVSDIGPFVALLTGG